MRPSPIPSLILYPIAFILAPLLMLAETVAPNLYRRAVRFLTES